MAASPSVRDGPTGLPTTEALLSIDALPVWRASAGVSRKQTSRRAAESSRSRPAAGVPPSSHESEIAEVPIEFLKTQPSSVAVTDGRHTWTGVWSIGLGIAVGLLATWPFLDTQPPSGSGAATAAHRYPPAALEPVPFTKAAMAAVIAPPAAAPLLPADEFARVAGDFIAVPIEKVRDVDVLDPAPMVEALLVEPRDAPLIALPSLTARSADIKASVAQALPDPAGGIAGPSTKSAPLLDRAELSIRARIVIHYSESDGRPAAEALARRLSRNGMKEVEFRKVSFTIRQQEVRVFSAPDTTRAMRVATAASAGARPLYVADFRHYRPRASPGLIEIWVR